jgi:ribosomal protein S18 acetylase RimI-like enzyme
MQFHYQLSAYIWVYVFNDEEIWGSKNEDPSIYIHRIATNPKFRGQNLVAKVIEWAKSYAIMNNKQYVRLDIAGENLGLIKLYTRNGFNFLGAVELENPKDLPSHYANKKICLFEIELTSKENIKL